METLTSFFFKEGDGQIMGQIEGASGDTVAYQTSSDERLKTNIRNLEGALDILSQIQPRIFEWRDGNENDIGFIAQEMLEAYPYIVSGDPNGNPKTEPMMIEYGRITPLLTKAIQEQQTQIQELSNQNQQLKHIICKNNPQEEICR